MRTVRIIILHQNEGGARKIGQELAKTEFVKGVDYQILDSEAKVKEKIVRVESQLLVVGSINNSRLLATLFAEEMKKVNPELRIASFLLFPNRSGPRPYDFLITKMESVRTCENLIPVMQDFLLGVNSSVEK